MNHKGFSLLEILIAVSILATSFTALISAQGSSFLASERADRMTRATFLARQKMAELDIKLEHDLAKNKFPEQDVEETGQFDEPYDDFRWKYTLKEVKIPYVEQESEEGQNVMIGSYMKEMSEQISKAVREVQLTIFWGDKDQREEDQPKFVVTTHIVNLKAQ